MHWEAGGGARCCQHTARTWLVHATRHRWGWAGHLEQQTQAACGRVVSWTDAARAQAAVLAEMLTFVGQIVSRP